MAPGLAWPLLRTAIALAMLALRGFGAVRIEGPSSAVFTDVASAAGIALVIAALPMILPRYRSFRVFSWLLLIVCACELQLSRDRWLG